MKKSILLLFSLLVILSLFSSLIIAETCENLHKKVCGTTPNSLIGYGAVDICNNCYACGVKDNVCPEDFYSIVTHKHGSCRNCPDPDCSATVEGWVKSIEGNYIPGAQILISTGTKQIPLQDTDGTNVTTDNQGHYSSAHAIAGLVKFYASYQDYDTEIISTEIIRGSTGNVINITVSPGACNSDCTDKFGTICKARCNGVNGCEFTDGRLGDVSSTSSYTSEYIASRCDGYVPGTRFPVYENATNIVYAQCCDMGKIVQPRPVLQTTFAPGTTDCIENLGTHVIKAKYKGQTVKVVVKSWDSTC